MRQAACPSAAALQGTAAQRLQRDPETGEIPHKEGSLIIKEEKDDLKKRDYQSTAEPHKASLSLSS